MNASDVASCRLSFAFDAGKMQQEVKDMLEVNWIPHYNKRYHEGEWGIITLRSIGGKAENVYAIPSTTYTGKKNYEDTIFLEHCQYIKQVLDHLKCEKTLVRLMRLGRGALIKPHCDHDLAFDYGEVRLHVPIQTNSQVEFFLDEKKIIMKEGECWYLDLTLTHYAHNGSETDRIHLVIDCIVNDWLREQLADSNTIVWSKKT